MFRISLTYMVKLKYCINPTHYTLTLNLNVLVQFWKATNFGTEQQNCAVPQLEKFSIRTEHIHVFTIAFSAGLNGLQA